MAANIRIVGNDDLGILSNITSIIAKDLNINLRNVTVDSHDGIFQGILTVGVTDTAQLNALIRKIGTVKGVKNVTRM